MAGQGRPPKPPEQRINRVKPKRGEWVDLEPLDKPVLPALPKRSPKTGSWSARSRSAWKAWRADPVTGEYSEADVQAALDLIFIYEDWVREGTAALAAEVRQRQDRLGLNPKGKRDLRWRIGQGDSEREKASHGARRHQSRTARRSRLELVGG